MRLFIALSLPEEIKDFIGGFVSEIKPHFPGVRWESRNKFHITLKFLGEVEEEKYLQLSKDLDEVLKNIEPVEAEIEKLTGYPSLKNPKVIVLRLFENKDIQKIYNIVDVICRENGFASEKRKFTPHVTIARVKSSYKVIRPIEKNIERKRFCLSKVSIIRSELSKAGSKYSNLNVWNLDSK